MEDKGDREMKHVCVQCSKRFPNGKSLGGHMRSHVIASSNASLHRAKSNYTYKASVFDAGSEGRRERESSTDHDKNAAVGDSGYGLRENPKKTWRVFHTGLNVEMKNVCEQCGKAFKSVKALCGHMSCHSRKERHFLDDEDDPIWTHEEEDEEVEEEEEDDDNVEGKGFPMDSQSSEIVVEADQMPNRSKEVRYKNLAANSFTLNNGSYSNTEIEQEQDEEVAISLMMLSRDFGRKRVTITADGANLVAELSDNNSVIWEDGSSSSYVGVTRSECIKYGSNCLHTVEMKQLGSEKLKGVEMDNSDSGYFENGAKELESDGSVDGFIGTYGYIKHDQIDHGSEVGALVHPGKEDYGGARTHLKLNLRSRKRNGFDCIVVQESMSKKIKHDIISLQSPKVVQKARKYECSICNDVVDTHQALGGHMMKHKRAGEVIMECSSSPEADSKRRPEKKTEQKKTKEHQCPYCPKSFRTGQALGGHKRSHLMGSGRGPSLLEETNPDPLVKDKAPLLDLNLPAPVEQGDNEHVHMMPW